MVTFGTTVDSIIMRRGTRDKNSSIFVIMKENRVFGTTGLQVSPLGFGGAPIGYLATEQQQVARILNLLLDAGVNVIDTAECYPGSESLIGQAVGHRRKEFVLVTKCGHQAE